MTKVKELPTYEVFTLRFKKSHYMFHVLSDSNEVSIQYFKKGCRLPIREGVVSRCDARLVWKELINRGAKQGGK